MILSLVIAGSDFAQNVPIAPQKSMTSVSKTSSTTISKKSIKKRRKHFKKAAAKKAQPATILFFAPDSHFTELTDHFIKAVRERPEFIVPLFFSDFSRQISGFCLFHRRQQFAERLIDDILKKQIKCQNHQQNHHDNYPEQIKNIAKRDGRSCRVFRQLRLLSQFYF